MLIGWAVVKAGMFLFHITPPCAFRLLRTVPGLRGFVRGLLLMFRLEYERPFWRSLGVDQRSIPISLECHLRRGAAFVVAADELLVHTPTWALR